MSAVLAVWMSPRRPRMGAWIEIGKGISESTEQGSRPRMGAWIEIKVMEQEKAGYGVAPAWGRGLK